MSALFDWERWGCVFEMHGMSILSLSSSLCAVAELCKWCQCCYASLSSSLHNFILIMHARLSAVGYYLHEHLVSYTHTHTHTHTHSYTNTNTYTSTLKHKFTTADWYVLLIQRHCWFTHSYSESYKGLYCRPHMKNITTTLTGQHCTQVTANCTQNSEQNSYNSFLRTTNIRHNKHGKRTLDRIIL